MNKISGPRQYELHIAGYTPGTRSMIERSSPATGQVVSRFASGTAEDAEAAINIARNAFDNGDWPRWQGKERAAVLRKWADLIDADKEMLARIEVDEVGKPIRMARDDIAAAVDLFHYSAGLAQQGHGETIANMGQDKCAWVHREPVGVVGMIIPWNFPAVVLSQKLPYALAAGCTVVVKPSEFTSGTAIEIARLGRQAGLPEGVLSVVTGYGDPVGETLVKSPDVDLVSFTGSTTVGRRVIRNSAETIKRVALELGGKSANIVFVDADMDDAIDGSLFGIFFNQGECCCSATRLLVDERIADEFVEKLAARAAKLKVGSVHEEVSEVGAMINRAHFDKVCTYLKEAVSEGATLRCGGNSSTEHGLYVEPTIFDHVQPEMSIYREEVFGPVLSVSRFKTLDQAVEMANDTEYGLANTIWTKNFDTAHLVAPRLRSGTVWINTTIDIAPQTPFGGYKASGFGREMGNAGFEEFTQTKSIVARFGQRKRYYDEVS